MINPFKIKEVLGLIVPQLITILGFMIIFTTNGFFIAAMSSVLLMVIGLVVGKLIIKNPFTEMLKGNGLLTIPIDSKGILNPFLCTFSKGHINGVFDGEEVKAPFDRKVVFNIEYPEKISMVKDKDANLYLKISQDEISERRFGMYHLPVLLYNAQLGSFITKDWLSEKETHTFARHHIIHANKIAERLTKEITNFGRYIADNAMQKFKNILSNPIVKILITIAVVGLIGYLLFKFAPALLTNAKEAIPK